MQQRTFGNTGQQVAAIGQGSWQIEDGDTAQAVAALRAGLDLGMTHIDTAEMYGSGAAERVVGEAIRGRREEVFLVSKVLPSNASKNGTIEACERSLRNLGTDYLDCYLLHWPSAIPLVETVAGFEQLKRDGKIRAWGVSNFDVPLLEEVTALGGPPACNQVLYHIAQRGCEHAVLPWCEKQGVALVAYTPLGQSKSMHDPRTAQGRVLNEVAKRHGASSRQVALAWLLRNESVFVIPKAAQLAHVIENADAAKLQLTAEDIAALETAFPRGAKPRQLPTA
jgi:diketogulonate reductase-like aldo/keto reductase